MSYRDILTSPSRRSISVSHIRQEDTDACGVPLLSQARDLGTLRGLPGDGAVEMNAFKL
jgi:hypothetical protein